MTSYIKPSAVYEVATSKIQLQQQSSPIQPSRSTAFGTRPFDSGTLQYSTQILRRGEPQAAESLDGVRSEALRHSPAPSV